MKIFYNANGNVSFFIMHDIACSWKLFLWFRTRSMCSHDTGSPDVWELNAQPTVKQNTGYFEWICRCLSLKWSTTRFLSETVFGISEWLWNSLQYTLNMIQKTGLPIAQRECYSCDKQDRGSVQRPARTSICLLIDTKWRMNIWQNL